jgi:peptide-methionine (R)-S-oxide reductase
MTDRACATRTGKIAKTEAEWRAQLPAAQSCVIRQHGTERAGTPRRNCEMRRGMFACVCCGEARFVLEAKFYAGTDWSSIDKPVPAAAVTEHADPSLLMPRTEVRCARCEAHLGQVFPHGPSEAEGLRSCINGAALQFKPGGT